MLHLEFSANADTLKNKVILVTGAGDGIGKQAALSYAQAGANVVLLGKTVSKLEQVYDEIMAQGLVEPSIIPLDLMGATPQHYKDMASTIKSQLGGLDGVLFNASLLGNLCPFEQIKASEYEEVMQVNVNSKFHIMQALLPVLKESNAASVIFTTSSVGRNGRAFWGTYSISKFATEGMMQILADENKKSSVRFNCINPGATRTNMRAKAYPAEKPESLKTPLDIMPSYLYLMADASKSVNGQSLDCQPK
ncbi:YciK family oxidoreductase [Glaciecola sp. KUL10]|uniref:YciK family oxidoreductase n=1 Tax=Glaciecola sp. (strain KUL10) TaxID=2161813 RepID=UPI000D785D6D|nr:YciK family oxidoreductase [Glaciecola sp. KUL10]GBL05376.1 short chain dehydrogenase [Glaciecola sp. KUL10]